MSIQHQVEWLHQQQWSLTPELSIIRVTVQQGLFGHIARLPAVVPASAALFIASTATDGVSPMPNWNHSRGRLPKTGLKQITADLDTTAADALQLATGYRVDSSRNGCKATRSTTMMMMSIQYNTVAMCFTTDTETLIRYLFCIIVSSMIYTQH